MKANCRCCHREFERALLLNLLGFILGHGSRPMPANVLCDTCLSKWDRERSAAFDGFTMPVKVEEFHVVFDRWCVKNEVIDYKDWP